MSLTIGPDLGDTTVITQQGANFTISYWFRDDDFNGGVKTFFEAAFPGDFTKISIDGLEEALLQLAMRVARDTGVHS